MKFYVPIFYYAEGKICVDAENQKDALSFASKLLKNVPFPGNAGQVNGRWFIDKDALQDSTTDDDEENDVNSVDDGDSDLNQDFTRPASKKYTEHDLVCIRSCQYEDCLFYIGNTYHAEYDSSSGEVYVADENENMVAFSEYDVDFYFDVIS